MANIVITNAGLRAAWNSDGTGLDFSVAYFRLFRDAPSTLNADIDESDLGDMVYPSSGHANITSTRQVTNRQYEFRILLDSSVDVKEISSTRTFQSIGLYLNDGTGGAGGTLFAVVRLGAQVTKSATSGGNIGNTFRLHIPIRFNENTDAIDITNIADPVPARIVEVADLESLGKAIDAGTRVTESTNYIYQFTLPSSFNNGDIVATLPYRSVTISIEAGANEDSLASLGNLKNPTGADSSNKGIVIVGNQVRISTSGSRYLGSSDSATDVAAIANSSVIRITHTEVAANAHNVYLVQDLNILAHVPIDTDGDQWEFDGYHYIGDIDIAATDNANTYVEVIKSDTDNTTTDLDDLFPLADYTNYTDGDLIVQTKTEGTGGSSTLEKGLAKRISALATSGSNARLTFTRSDGPEHNMEDGDTLALYVRIKAALGNYLPLTGGTMTGAITLRDDIDGSADSDEAVSVAWVRDQKVPHRIEIDEIVERETETNNGVTRVTGIGADVIDNKYITPDILAGSRIYARAWGSFGYGTNPGSIFVLYDDYNISSIVDNNNADYVFRFENRMTNNLYARIASGSTSPPSGTPVTGTPTILVVDDKDDRILTGSVRFHAVNPTNGNTRDIKYGSFAIMGSEHKGQFIGTGGILVNSLQLIITEGVDETYAGDTGITYSTSQENSGRAILLVRLSTAPSGGNSTQIDVFTEDDNTGLTFSGGDGGISGLTGDNANRNGGVRLTFTANDSTAIDYYTKWQVITLIGAFASIDEIKEVTVRLELAEGQGTPNLNSNQGHTDSINRGITALLRPTS